jgi:hypothetical protein
MAIEIKRTPVLEGNASEAFLKSIKGNQTTKVSATYIRTSIESSKKILEAYKAKSR